MFCCEKCFHDRYLIHIMKLYKEVGNCDYCNSKAVFITEIENIAQLFKVFDSYYKELEHSVNINLNEDEPFDVGENLFDSIQNEWQIFNNGSSTDKLFKDIMKANNKEYQDDILYKNEGESYYYESNLGIWEDFSTEIKSKNRFFPNIDIVNVISVILEQSVLIIPGNSIFYRGRLDHQDIDKMGAPPSEKATAGRANPKGISYLYTANDRGTCIAELRPYKGAVITIVEVTTNKTLNLVYLNTNKIVISPFQFEGDLLKNLETVKLYNLLVSELSKPVRPENSELDYLPTQFLSELIKQQGFDGFLFKSSIGPRDNYVFFDQNNVSISRPEFYTVDGIEYKFHREIFI